MRNFFKILHKWLSIPVGIIITISCLTGAMLVFQDEIQEASNPSHYFVKNIGTPLSLDSLIPMVNSQLENNTVADVKIPSDPKRTYTMTLTEGFRISAFVDPYTGKVTGIYSFRESPFYKIMSLHRWLMDGSHTWGKYTVGISTLIFVFILISGLILWMPRKINKDRFKIQFHKGKKRLLYDLHSVLGVYACLMLLVCALTGMMWSFEWYKNGVFKLFGVEAVAKKENRKSSDKKEKKEINITSWNKVLQNLQASIPDYEYIRVQDGVAQVHLQSAITSRATDKYTFNKETGDIASVKLFQDQDGSTKLWAWVYSLHVGNYLGIWSKVFNCFFAFVGASLPITGYYMFFIKRKRKSKKT